MVTLEKLVPKTLPVLDQLKIRKGTMDGGQEVILDQTRFSY